MEFGVKDGIPIFYFHGTPGSALEGALFGEAAERHHARIIAVDRPGVGLSDYQDGRRVIDWAKDVEQIANHLGLDSFSVLGWSGGGPHALVCAIPLQRRLRGVGLVAPQNEQPLFNPALERLAGHLWLPAFRFLMRFPNLSDRLLEAGFRHTDKRHQRRKDKRLYKKVFVRSHQRAQATSSRGVVHDNDALLGDWGISVQEIADQLRKLDPALPITIWQGAQDSSVNVRGTLELADELPDCTLIYDPFASHLEIVLDQTDSIVSMLCRPRPPRHAEAKTSDDLPLDRPTR